PIPFLHPALDIPYCHHERWDGGGYPRGLQGVEIPLSARIFALVDVWDALRFERPYKPAYSEEHALQIIREQSGRQLDPAVVAIFLQMLPELREQEG
ncbi:MAG: HD domain-containing phosphohydrolase, partial [Chloroflexales bacterium]